MFLETLFTTAKTFRQSKYSSRPINSDTPENEIRFLRLKKKKEAGEISAKLEVMILLATTHTKKVQNREGLQECQCSVWADTGASRDMTSGSDVTERGD